MDTTTFTVPTGAQFAVVDLTDQVVRWVRGRGDGLCHLLALHATAGLGLMETGSGSEQDAHTVIERLLPTDEQLYRHRHGNPGHGRDHVLPLFVSPSLTIAVVDGEPVLGTWQSVVLVDPNVDNPRRRVHASFLVSEGEGERKRAGGRGTE
jgi:secondary thiamine-phosphate synthase enzyme